MPFPKVISLTFGICKSASPAKAAVVIAKKGAAYIKTRDGRNGECCISKCSSFICGCQLNWRQMC